MKRWHKLFAVLLVCLLTLGTIGYLGIQHSEKAAYAADPLTPVNIDPGTDYFIPVGISDSGIVGGNFQFASEANIAHAGTWQSGSDNPFTNSGTAEAISPAGEVVGYSYPHPVKWSSNGTATNLGGSSSGSCNPDTNDSVAYAVNDVGDIAGLCFDSNGVEAGYWPGGATNSYTKLPDLINPSGYSYALGINHGSTIVGYSAAYNPSAPYSVEGDAVAWQNGTAQDISPAGATASEAVAINDNNLAVGTVNFNTDSYNHAYVWDLASNHNYDLYTLTDHSAHATAVNNSGAVVGDFDTGNGDPNTSNHAFMWKVGDSNITDLNSLLPANSGWILTSAIGINSSGQIVGTGFINGIGHHYLLNTSTPSSYRLSLAPASQTATIRGGQGLVKATLLDSATSAPASNVKLSFRVEAGPNDGLSGTCFPSSCTTDANGLVDWGYLGKAIGVDTVQAWMDTNGNGVPDTGEVQTTATVSWIQPKPQTYLALGDSYSSGEGNPPFSADQDCHRSYDAWPFLLANSDVRLFLLGNYACSGAKASNSLRQSYNPCSLILQLRKCPQEPQISVMKSLKPNIVTITIGGNDIGFAESLEICYAAGIDHRQYLCDAWLHYEAWVINRLEKAAISYYKEIKAALPNTSKVYIVGYPNLFPTNQKYTTHCGWLSNAGRVEFNKLAILLDKDLHDAANAARVNYISTLYALKGHELCTSNSWVNPILPKDTLIGDDYHNDGHPTFAGQEAMETMVDAGIFG